MERYICIWLLMLEDFYGVGAEQYFLSGGDKSNCYTKQCVFILLKRAFVFVIIRRLLIKIPRQLYCSKSLRENSRSCGLLDQQRGSIRAPVGADNHIVIIVIKTNLILLIITIERLLMGQVISLHTLTIESMSMRQL